MRTTWNGSISFGLVNIPVGLAPATASSARQSDVQFKLLHRECLTPIKQKRWCPVHDVELAPGRDRARLGGREGPVRRRRGRRARGARELRHLARRSRSRGSSRPARSTRSTSTAPTTSSRPRTEAQRRPYALLLEAMSEADVVGLGSFVLAGKEKLCLIRPKGEALALETLFLAEDVKSQEEIDEPVAATGGQEGGARARPADHLGPRRHVRPGRAAQRLPGAAAGAARGEARGPRARRAPEPERGRRRWST